MRWKTVEFLCKNHLLDTYIGHMLGFLPTNRQRSGSAHILRSHGHWFNPRQGHCFLRFCLFWLLFCSPFFDVVPRRFHFSCYRSSAGCHFCRFSLSGDTWFHLPRKNSVPKVCTSNKPSAYIVHIWHGLMWPLYETYVVHSVTMSQFLRFLCETLHWTYMIRIGCCFYEDMRSICGS